MSNYVKIFLKFRYIRVKGKDDHGLLEAVIRVLAEGTEENLKQ
jgi:predicted amino acid-binding ACT domain protein